MIYFRGFHLGALRFKFFVYWIKWKQSLSTMKLTCLGDADKQSLEELVRNWK